MAAAAVALGAFGAHGLKDRLTAADLEIWQTASHYHLIHAVALVVVGFGCGVLPAKSLRIAGWLMLVGQLVFGGTLYLLALTGIRWLGAITPIGGICMILGWIFVAVSALRSPTDANA
jgi:uncharacterized membrane protein YgdD (TMEM256/DUF423 family)